MDIIKNLEINANDLKRQGLDLIFEELFNRKISKKEKYKQFLIVFAISIFILAIFSFFIGEYFFGCVFSSFGIVSFGISFIFNKKLVVLRQVEINDQEMKRILKILKEKQIEIKDNIKRYYEESFNPLLDEEKQILKEIEELIDDEDYLPLLKEKLKVVREKKEIPQKLIDLSIEELEDYKFNIVWMNSVLHENNRLKAKVVNPEINQTAKR